MTFGIGEEGLLLIPRARSTTTKRTFAGRMTPAKGEGTSGRGRRVGPDTRLCRQCGLDEVDEQIAVLLQQQFAEAGITANLQKVDPSQSWDMLVNGDYGHLGHVLDQRYSRS